MPNPEANLLDTRTAAALLDLTPRRLQQLSQQGWFKPAKRGRWPLVSTVRGYVAFLKTGSTEDRRSSASSLHAARTAEIERRMAIQDRRIIALDEALGCVDEICGAFISSFSTLPARITRNPSEIRRIEAILDAERQRLSDRFAQIEKKARAGLADPEEEDD